jgi:hypothetical protein
MSKALEAICKEVPTDSTVLDLHAGGAICLLLWAAAALVCAFRASSCITFDGNNRQSVSCSFILMHFTFWSVPISITADIA